MQDLLEQNILVNIIKYISSKDTLKLYQVNKGKYHFLKNTKILLSYFRDKSAICIPINLSWDKVGIPELLSKSYDMIKFDYIFKKLVKYYTYVPSRSEWPELYKNKK